MTGSRVYLRGLVRGDMALLTAWINDPDVTRFLFMGARPAIVELLEAQWERDAGNQSEVAFAVCDRTTDAFIGTTGLYSINFIMRTAEFRVFLGDKSTWNRGIGTECAKLMVIFGFDKLNLNRLWLGVNAENKGALKAYDNAGFTREGVLRQEQYRNFQYYDVVRMGMLREDYVQTRESYFVGSER